MGDRTRPTFCTDAHLTYLDRLRKSGKTNMWGAGRYLERRFLTLRGGSKSRHTSDKARDVLLYWMDTFGKETR